METRKMVWTVYGLIDPRDNSVFYIGCSENVHRRVREHCCDSASSAWPRCRDIESSGLTIEFCILGVFDIKLKARLLEGRLILTLPAILNKKTYHALPRAMRHRWL